MKILEPSQHSKVRHLKGFHSNSSVCRLFAFPWLDRTSKSFPHFSFFSNAPPRAKSWKLKWTLPWKNSRLRSISQLKLFISLSPTFALAIVWVNKWNNVTQLMSLLEWAVAGIKNLQNSIYFNGFLSLRCGDRKQMRVRTNFDGLH